MKNRITNWQRISKLRDAQCKIAISEASAAFSRLENLQQSAKRLAQLRNEARDTGPHALGQDLHARLELDERLLHASDQLKHSMEQASSVLERAEQNRLDRYIDRESADKLFSKARAELAELEQLRSDQLYRNRARKSLYQEAQDQHAKTGK